jgi:uncharacterized heparinase superfamily protein
LVEFWRSLARQNLSGVAEMVVTSPLVRWTWSGHGDDKFETELSEYRPTDRETVLEMLEGRYLLAYKLVDTHGVSPFSVEDADAEWWEELQSFSWLRHFRDARDESERRFARTLVLDWIGRDGQFSPDTWALGLCSKRVLNWLRHYKLLVEGASTETQQTIGRALGTQIQSIKFRSQFARDPVERLLAAIAMVGIAICEESEEELLESRLQRLARMLVAQTDEFGLHFSRSAKVQFTLLTELLTIRKSLDRGHDELVPLLEDQLQLMHQALHAITLGTGEPAYFNGTGQLPHDLLVTIQASSPASPRRSRVIGGYGILTAGQSVVIADSGQVPEAEYAREAHCGVGAFEFSHGTELVVGSCGPAPSNMPDSQPMFRQGFAHTAATINSVSATQLSGSGEMGGRPHLRGNQPEIGLDTDAGSLWVSTDGYRRQFGVDMERRMSLISEGLTLVGQDRFSASRPGRISGVCALRFHLAPGTDAVQSEDEDLVRLRLQYGQVWTFLWEGAEMRLEESVRQSAYFGFQRTQQIVLEAPVEDGTEIAWIFTRQQA